MPPARKPLAISHRGAHHNLPENSIPAFLQALELGADAIELDVHATRDGQVVVHHDFVVHAEGVPDQRIEDITFAELKRFPLGGGIGIPTLRETLEAVGGRALTFIEIKAVNIEALVVRVIRESQSDCAVHSFDHRIVRTVRKIFPAIRTGVLQVARLIDPVAPLLQAGAQDLWQHVDYIDEDLVTAAQSAGARVIAWTANDPTRWKELASLGIDGVCSDRIGELAAANIQLR